MTASPDPAEPVAAGAPGSTPGKVPDADACRAQLARILASPDFDVSDRDRRFLSHVVHEALAGRADRIKAYSIAVEVFGRDPSFDPQTDPIVRVEAGHLRRALDRYYLGTGRADPVEIAIPKGGYAPRFAWAATPAAAATPDGAPSAVPAGTAPAQDPRSPGFRWRVPLRVWAGIALLAGVAMLLLVATVVMRPLAGAPQPPTRPDVPRLLVQPFEDLSRPGQPTALAEGLTQEVIGQIAKFRDIVVLSGERTGTAVSSDPATAAPRYALAGTVEIDDQTLRVQARILSRTDGAVLWADTYSGDLSVARLLEIERDIADRVATTLAQPYGVIFQADTQRQVDRPPEDWTAYACTLSYYAYRATLDPATHPVVRRCLEQAVARFPSYATAWALLSQIYIDEVRFRFAADPKAGPASVDRALAAARRAVTLDPMNIRGLQAQMFALYFAGDVEAAVQVGRRALDINPNDTELMGEVGFRLALSGDWDAGCPLMEEAWQRNPGPLGYYGNGLALCAYMRNDFDAARMWIRSARMADNPQYHLIAAIIFGEAGDPQAAAEVDWIRAHAPHLYDHARREIALRVARPEDVERFLASLRKAGLPVDARE